MKTSCHTTQMQATRKHQTHPPASASKPHNRLISPTTQIAWPTESPNPSAPASRSKLARTYPARTLFLAGVQSLCAPLLKILLQRRASPNALSASPREDHSKSSCPARARMEPSSPARRYTPQPTAIDPHTPESSVPLATVCRLVRHISSASLPCAGTHSTTPAAALQARIDSRMARLWQDAQDTHLP